MMRDEDKKLLFPAYPLMHVGLGDDYKEYMLSGVLGTHGYTIRNIHIEDNGYVEVLCRSEIKDNTGRGRLIIQPLAETKVRFNSGIHWNDLRLRYRFEEGLSDPLWTQAFSFGSGLKGDSLVAVIDLVGMTYSVL